MSELEQQSAAEQGGGRRWWVEAGVLGVLCLLVRCVGLMGMPIFGDEAIYVRWAELAREGHWWVCLIDPKPPLHFWMIAGVMGWTADPLLAARLISVLAGVLSVPALMGVCGELARLANARMSGRVLGLLAAVLMIFSPFVSFYQRLATADAVFVLEMLVVVWVALRWARGAGRNGWGLAGALGVAMGLTLMTRQGLSYTLWGVVGMALLVQWKREKIWVRLGQLAMAGLIAAVVWSPYLLAELPNHVADAMAENPQATEWTVIKERIFYQQQFTSGEQVDHTRVALRNAGKTFLPFWFEPGWGGQVHQVMGWLPGYMTWPVYGLAIVGLVYWAVRKEWRVVLVVGCWMVMMIGPTLTLNVIYSRYVLSGAVVMLLPTAWVIAEGLGVVAGWRNFGWMVAAVLLLGVLGLGMREVGRQSSRWWEQNLTQQDRYQYVTGWSAGAAVDRAMGILRKEAEAGPIVVITDAGWGLPADAVWDKLQGVRNVSVYYTSKGNEGAILLPAETGEPGSYLLRKDKWLYTPAVPVRIDPAAQVFYITRIGANDDTTEKHLRELNPQIGRELIFSGIDRTEDKVAVFSVK